MTGRSGFICAGNWIVDLVHDIDRWPNESELSRIRAQTRGIGGGPANVIATLAKLDTGLPLYPMGAIGDDAHGAYILDECRRLGLPTDRLKPKPGIATAHTHVMSVAGRSRTFFYMGGANDVLAASDFPTGTFADTSARIFYLGYLTLLGELDAKTIDGSTGATQVLERARKAGLVTCVDLVSIPHPEFPRVVASAAPSVDYFISNEIEAALATQRGTNGDPPTDGHNLLMMAQTLLGLGVQKAAVVHCAERVAWVGVDGQSFVVDVEPLPAEEIASHLGAGDAFCAGLLYGIHEDLGPENTIRLATATARASLRGLTATSAIPTLSALEL